MVDFNTALSSAIGANCLRENRPERMLERAASLRSRAAELIREAEHLEAQALEWQGFKSESC